MGAFSKQCNLHSNSKSSNMKVMELIL